VNFSKESPKNCLDSFLFRFGDNDKWFLLLKEDSGEWKPLRLAGIDLTH
jgi:hypothetical protein